MAEKSKPEFTLGDLGTIKEGILAEEAGFQPFKKLGLDFTLRPETVFGALPFVGGLTNMGQAIGKYQLEDSANKFYGVDKGFKDTSISSGMNDSATNSLIKEIKAFKENDPYSTTSNITRDDIQNFMMQKKPDLDLAPIQKRMYTQKQLDDRTTDFYKPEQTYFTQPFSSGSFAEYGDDYKKSLDNMRQKYNQDEEFKSSMGSYAMRDMQTRYDDNLKTTDNLQKIKLIKQT